MKTSKNVRKDVMFQWMLQKNKNPVIYMVIKQIYETKELRNLFESYKELELFEKLSHPKQDVEDTFLKIKFKEAELNTKIMDYFKKKDNSLIDDQLYNLFEMLGKVSGYNSEEWAVFLNKLDEKIEFPPRGHVCLVTGIHNQSKKDILKNYFETQFKDVLYVDYHRRETRAFIRFKTASSCQSFIDSLKSKQLIQNDQHTFIEKQKLSENQGVHPICLVASKLEGQDELRYWDKLPNSIKSNPFVKV